MGKTLTQNFIMRCSLALILSVLVLLSVFLPALEAASARRRGKAARRGGIARRVQQGRRGRGRMLARKGRQDADATGDYANAVDGEAEEEIYNGCDPATNIGGFLIQKLWRKKCVELEYTNFGGYGGIPTEEEEEVEE